MGRVVSLQYRNCRWYDVYPKLAFVLKLVKLMPFESQILVGERLNQYLTHRRVDEMLGDTPQSLGNRWYDNVQCLMEGLERLKHAPHPVKEQSTDYLLKMLKDDKAENPRCA